MNFETSQEFAKSLDQQDPLNCFRSRFIIPKNKDGSEKIYFLGNSLGLQPVTTRHHISAILDQWSSLGVEGFFEGDEPWLALHDQLSELMAAIVGALPSEVVIMNQLTVNLHLMMAGFYKPVGKKKKILCEQKAFPSDQYMLESFIRFLNMDPDDVIIEIPADKESGLISEDLIIQMIEANADELALVMMGGVNYYSGQALNIELITAAAQKAGAIAGFDLAHAAGNIPLRLHDWNVDFACWCNYKYLNAGPGAVGSAFIHERYHRDSSIKRFAGWWGHNKEKRFLMEKGFDPIHSAEGWQLSTPPIILYAAVKASLEIFHEVTMEKLFYKSKKLSDYLFFLLTKFQSEYPGILKVLTPTDPRDRGSQVSMLMLRDGRKTFDHLTGRGIFADWREPNVIRIAPVPLYNSFEEAWYFFRTLSLLHDKARNH